MLQFAGYTWLLDVRDSPIRARIETSCRWAHQVRWQVELNYIAGGRAWRRVKSLLRPALRLCIYGFEPAIGRWEELEGAVFASEPDAEDYRPGGSLFLEAHRFGALDQELENGSHRLRFLRRDGIWFTTELAVLAGASANRAVTRESVSSLRNEWEEFSATVSDPWIEDAALYLVEDLPFGLVEVEVPINAPHPERYARVRARELLGLNAVRECDTGPKKEPVGQRVAAIPGAGWQVRLHSGGRWTHFTPA